MTAEIIDLIGRRQSDMLTGAGFAAWPVPRPGTETGGLWIYDLCPAIDAALAADQRLADAIARYTAALDREAEAGGRAPREDGAAP